MGCILGMGIPALLSLQFAAGRQVRGDSLAALTAQGVVEKTGEPIFWFLTLLCGFMVLGPAQIGAADAFCRRWTDLIWTASKRARGLKEEKVKLVYYTLLTAYALWGVMALTPDSRPHDDREDRRHPAELRAGVLGALRPGRQLQAAAPEN